MHEEAEGLHSWGGGGGFAGGGEGILTWTSVFVWH